MSRILAYCGYLRDEKITTPTTGVGGSQVNLLAQGRLHLLWSEVPWPFDQGRLQQNALEFHVVVQHVFAQTAVVPFRLLSVFEDLAALQKFVAENAPGFIADLERLENYVQMESVVYVIAPRAEPGSVSGREYLQKRADIVRLRSEHAARVKEAVASLSHDVHVREVKNGARIFALVPRGKEAEFRESVQSVPVPEPVSRRVSGPWPAAEFLSDVVKAPHMVRRG